MLSVFIGAKNEEEHISNTIHNVLWGARQAGLKEFEILVVNDGSTDRTREIVEELQKKHPQIQLINHEKSKGYGASFLSALEKVKYDRVTCFAGDNNAHAQVAEALFSNIDKADLVITFFVNTENRSRFRNVLSTLFSLFYTTAFGLHVQYINGNAIYPTKLLKTLKLRARNYSMFSEIQVKLLRKGITYYEVMGYQNEHAHISQALNFKTLLSVIKNFLVLVWEVYVSHRDEFNKLPKRAGIPAYNLSEPDKKKEELTEAKLSARGEITAH